MKKDKSFKASARRIKSEEDKKEKDNRKQARKMKRAFYNM